MFSQQAVRTQAERKEFDSSHINKLKKVIYRNKETFLSQSNCLETALNVVFFLSGESAFYSYKNARIIQTNEFFLKEAASYSHSIIKDLFSKSGSSEHSVFYILFDGNRHALVIEKESNKEITLYRVYQSWINKFTLIDWLDGRGKPPYTSIELIDFIQNTVNQISKENGPTGCCNFFCCGKKETQKSVAAVIKFKFNTHALEKYYDRIYPSESNVPEENLISMNKLAPAAALFQPKKETDSKTSQPAPSGAPARPQLGK